MASDSDIGTPSLALKNHERPKKVIKASEGQKSPKFQKPVILSIFNAKQSINANVLLENVDFYAKEKFQFYTMICTFWKKGQNFKLAINGY